MWLAIIGCAISLSEKLSRFIEQSLGTDEFEPVGHGRWRNSYQVFFSKRINAKTLKTNNDKHPRDKHSTWNSGPISSLKNTREKWKAALIRATPPNTAKFEKIS
jgi:hypothetical protein